MSWRVFVDRGGTFTDVVAVDGHRRVVRKVLSDARGGDAVLRGLREAVGDEEVESVTVGTTVATNALLTRTGQPTLLVTTRGFADALVIGDQTRPDLFALHVVRPPPLFARVVAVDERVSAEGEVLVPLDLEGARRSLRAALESGLRCAAIVLMHAWRWPAHEVALGALAREVGFTTVRLSHEVSPRMKFVPRGDTTVLDAYVSPVLSRYVETLVNALPGVRLRFMQSNGGLAAPEAFRGRDAVLSGPAGGVVGAALVSRAAGFGRVVAFDMGGTSTDVSRWAGEWERTDEAEVAGVRLRTPMMDVHTVAAGGGSVLHFDGGRYVVGPDSAGADPGPACYGRGGPATVTDANLVLGRIAAECFPRVFGASGRQPLDVEAARASLGDLAQAVGCGVEEAAKGCIEVAVATMARAIRRVSVERGHDVRDHVLCAFGGAAGQHACRIADALGMEAVLIHPDAGVLSAWGVGLAPQQVLRECAIERPLSEAAELEAQLSALEAAAVAALRDQGASPAQVLRFVRLRAAGSDTALEVGFGADLASRFDDAHRRRFGTSPPSSGVTVESLAVEARGPAPDVPQVYEGEVAPAPESTTSWWLGGRQTTVSRLDRAGLRPGTRVAGPALIAEPTGTTCVEPGWTAEVTPRRDLVLRRTTARPRVETSTVLDPVRLAVMSHRFMAIAEEMGATLEHTAHSVNIKERRDYSCALFDGAGRLVANAPHIPVHLGSMGDSVRAIIGARGATLRPGDAFLINDPYRGGTHLPDLTVVSPVFEGGRPRFFVAARGHHADVGGLTPGSMPPHSRRIEDEGLLVSDFHLAAGGWLQEAELRALLTSAGARSPDQNVADLRAQIAANARGEALLGELCAEVGAPVVEAYMRHVREHAAESVRRVLDRISGGELCLAADDGAVVAVRVTVDRESRRACIDFTGTSPQQATNANAPRAVTRAVVLYVFRALCGEDLPLNEGGLDPLDLVIPEGSMLDPRWPAAVVAGNVETSQLVADALLGAVGALAGSQGTMNNVTFGDGTRQYYETLCGGAGAGPGFDGASAVHTHMTNSRLTDPEVLEWRFPVLCESFAIRRGSGGNGRSRGGDGAVRRLRFLEPMTVGVLSSRRVVPPHGLAGGEPGSMGRNTVIRASGKVEDLGGVFATEVLPGDVLIVETPGGGGYGC